MTYVALLYSPQLDEFETDCNCMIYCSEHMAQWIEGLPEYYNHNLGVDDFYIISITKQENKMAWFDKNKYLICPNCHQSKNVHFVWAGGDGYRGNYEEDFICGSCGCEFTAVYKVVDIKITETGEKK